MTESTRTASAVLTVEEAAAVLRISRQSAYAAARAGELPTVKIGRRLLVPRARLLALLGELPVSQNSEGGESIEEATSPCPPSLVRPPDPSRR